MTSDDAIDIKEVIFLSQRVEDDYLSQPTEVVEAFDARITAVQNLRRLPARHHQALSGNAKGIEELRVFHDSNTKRTAKFRRNRLLGSWRENVRQISFMPEIGHCYANVTMRGKSEEN
ncbi:hypothetical protein [Pararhizobium sp. DWP1-1-3]|uniref:hypothetical protein n=1 Tax=Pararhizobium sp. DWP1-1-3 TaxID=2804652 RepID=UPI003CF5DCAD